MADLDITNYHCRACGECLDGATHINDENNEFSKELPAEGSISVCSYCGIVSIFTSDGFQKPTQEEFLDFMRDPNFNKGVVMVTLLRSCFAEKPLRAVKEKEA